MEPKDNKYKTNQVQCIYCGTYTNNQNRICITCERRKMEENFKRNFGNNNNNNKRR